MVGNLMYALTHSFNPDVNGQHNTSSHNLSGEIFGPDSMMIGSELGGGDMTKQQRYKVRPVDREHMLRFLFRLQLFV